MHRQLRKQDHVYSTVSACKVEGESKSELTEHISYINQMGQKSSYTHMESLQLRTNQGPSDIGKVRIQPHITNTCHTDPHLTTMFSIWTLTTHSQASAGIFCPALLKLGMTMAQKTM